MGLVAVLPVPRIVDFEWRLDYSMSGTASGKSNEHRYTVKLHLEHEGVRSTEEFTASLAQLRDLQGRVQGAMEAVRGRAKPSIGRSWFPQT